MVDDFGIKTVGIQHAKHLKATLERHYEVSVDWKGELFCGITLEWGYNRRQVDLSMPTYIPRALTKYQHPPPSKPQHAPYQAAPVQYGAKVQRMITDDPPIGQKADQAHPGHGGHIAIL